MRLTMGLNSSLEIGRSGLLVSQAAMEVAGNNLSNIATPGYHKRRAELAPASSQQIGQGLFQGRGVRLDAISRSVNEALEARLHTATGQSAASLERQDLLARLEAIQNEFTDIDLSTRLGEFFNRWSELANNPQDLSLRTLVIEEASTLADFIQNQHGQLVDLRIQTDQATREAVTAANDLLGRIESINQQIATQEAGYTGSAAGLRDERERLITRLSEHFDVSTQERNDGQLDVFVGSTPIVLAGKSRGVEIDTENIDGLTQIRVVTSDDRTIVNTDGGRIGALVAFNRTDLTDAQTTLDTFANQLIEHVNRTHTSGQGLIGRSSITGDTRVLDTSVALTDAAAELDVQPNHGSFLLHLTQKSTGQRVSTRINVDLDGLNANDTTLTSLAGDLNGVANLTATINAAGQLRLDAASSDFEISFSDDSSGALAALGVNALFSGGGSFDIAVSFEFGGDPRLVAAAQGHLPGDNRNALAVAGLRDTPVDGLSGLSLTGYWNRHVEDFAVRLGQARAQVDADRVVEENLTAQRESYSGVNVDEETIDLLRYQRTYQASARFINVVDELMQTLLSIV